MRPAFTFLLVVALVGGGWFASQQYPDRSAALLASLTNTAPAVTSARAPAPARAQLPPAADRSYPTPGYEEASGPLDVAPAVSATSTQYVFQQTQNAADTQSGPVAWSPCRPVHFVINSVGAPDGFADQVRGAFGELSAATGLVFVDDGSTTEAVAADRAPFLPAVYGDRWAPVLVQFADATTVPGLVTAVGLTLSHSAQDTTTGVFHLVSGSVYLDTELLARHDRSATPAYVPVLRHELGHLAGLEHVNDPTQLMNPVISDLLTYQVGDLAGLAALGHGTCAPGL